MRARLREAAARLVDGSAKVLDVALDCGFGDASNFNHAFKREFGVSPRAFRLAQRGRGVLMGLAGGTASSSSVRG